MFTGIVREIGRIEAVRKEAASARLAIDVGTLAGDVALGDSVCVDGACLTAGGLEGGTVWFDVSTETLRLTTLGELKPGSRVNLEPALRVGDRLGGHFVSGHVDGVGRILRKEPRPGEVRLEVEVAPELSDLMIMKGSVAVDGISLTIAALRRAAFEVSVIPHTLQETNLQHKDAGNTVNVECDMIGRWVRRILQNEATLPDAGSLSMGDLEEQGF